MARSTWKYIWTTTNDLKFLISKMQYNDNFFPTPSRHKTINMFNIGEEYRIYQGKTRVILPVDENYLNTKLGMFAKTRKPFFFRSKKKKR